MTTPAVATNLYMNWTSVVITPDVGAAITLKEITGIKIDGMSVQKAFYGDNRSFPRCLRNTAKTRKMEITAGSINTLLGIDDDMQCTIVAKLDDALNDELTGCITFTLKYAKRANLPFAGQNNEYASGTVTFNAASDEADDDPLSYSIA